MAAEGSAGKADYARAATWFTKAAEHGVRDSQYNLAILYARGLGLSQDLVQSYMWFSVAAAQGDADAAKKRDDVAAKLDPDKMTAAHLTLPLGTIVKVTRIDDEGKRKAGPVRVRINDRGPYGKSIIDLSAAAARRLRMFGGVARVRLEVVRLPKPKVRRKIRGA